MVRHGAGCDPAAAARRRLPRFIVDRLTTICYIMVRRGAGCDPAAAGCRHGEDALVSVYL